MSGGGLKISVCIGALLITLVSCKSESLRGVFYYGEAQRLMRLDLSTGQKEVLDVDPDRMMMSVAKIDEQRFIFGSHKLDLNPSPIVQSYDRSNHRISTIFRYSDKESSEIQGPVYIEKPIYMASRHVIIFHGAGGGIYWANIDKPREQHLIESGVRINYPLVQVADNELVFYDGTKVRLFDVDIGELSELNIADCVPYLWRSKTKQLLCSNSFSTKYFLTNLDDTGRQDLDPRYTGVPVYYIEQMDIAVFSGTKLGLENGVHEIGTIALYDFETRSVVKVINNVLVQSGALIYYPS
jgi:hypothetical protein